MTRRRTALAALALATAAAILIGPAALAQEYGGDVYGNDPGTDPYTATTKAATTGAATTAGAWTLLRSTLNGKVEVPAGDPDASGTAEVKVRGTQVCYNVKWAGMDPPTAAHIHKGNPGQAGAITVPFFASETPLTGGVKAGCATADAAAAKALTTNPGWYYVNVHNGQFPTGAIRGQLAKAQAAAPSGGAQLPYTGPSSRTRGLLLLGLSIITAGSMLLAARQRRPASSRRAARG